MKEYFNSFDDIQFFSYIFINISKYIDSNAKRNTALYSEFYALQDDIFFEPQIRVFKSPFFAILRTFSSITREICFQIKNKIHHVNQLIKSDLMMYIQMTFFKKKPLHPLHPLHSTHLFKIFFSLLTLSTAFLQKACEPGKNCSFTEMLYINRYVNYTRTFCSSFQISSKVLKRVSNQKIRY